ncbi:hypothetical protein [Mucilaginibacter agri]|uniref:Uncharacterized protein n=1 Tax=Mucilaginibacter agri TaxID=2695265 RepID=A0A966DUJ7_9SPHI|nr:hypothetical protein [Mucilaginibacter agri]NCD69699.1 hypothetical protein [Mucilaginibacter agri]
MQFTETAHHEQEMLRTISFFRRLKSTSTPEYIYLALAILAFLIASFAAIQQYAVIAY